MAVLESKIFTEKMNEPVVHEAVRWFLASGRQGSHKAKTRTEVSGGGKKPWKQKGTGRARAGSTRSPLWRHGGVIFPPTPRDHSYVLPVKMRRLALRVALSQFNRDDKIKIVDEIALSSPKTKAGVEFLKKSGVAGNVLVLLAADRPAAQRGLRNIAGVTIALSKDLNIFAMLKAEWLLIERPAVAQLETRLG